MYIFFLCIFFSRISFFSPTMSTFFPYYFFFTIYFLLISIFFLPSLYFSTIFFRSRYFFHYLFFPYLFFHYIFVSTMFLPLLFSRYLYFSVQNLCFPPPYLYTFPLYIFSPVSLYVCFTISIFFHYIYFPLHYL